jgi:hypothetical protein
MKRSQYLAAIAITAVTAGAAWAVHSVGTAEYCPQPSAASVAMLFAPCQAFDTAMGHAVTREEAVRMGLLPPTPGPASTPAKEPAPTPAQVVAQDFQTMAQEHATVGVARSK